MTRNEMIDTIRDAYEGDSLNHLKSVVALIRKMQWMPFPLDGRDKFAYMEVIGEVQRRIAYGEIA